MKKISVAAVICCILFISFTAECRMGGGGPGSVPRVAYTRPQSQSTVDLSGQKSLIFEWMSMPIPGGGRDSYRFVLHRGSGYDVIADKVLDPGIFLTEVPSEKFEDGVTYWWCVKQRDGKTLEWSQYDIWYFKVERVKK